MDRMSTTHEPGARSQQRQARRLAFRRYLRATLLGALLPGSAFIAGGRRRLGTVVLTIAGVLLLAAVATVIVVGPIELGKKLALTPQALSWLGVGMIVTAVLWVLLMVASQRALEPRHLSLGQRLLGTGLVVVLCSVVAAPLAVGSQYAFTQKDVIQSILPDVSITQDPGTLTRHEGVTVQNPWGKAKRINVLLIGGDHTTEREGTRTDTNIVASIDVATGRTVLFSLPRNLQRVPFPKGPFRKAYPHGFTNPAQPNQYLLNAIYDIVPKEHPELFPKSIRHPGVEALKLAVGQILDLKIDYYVLINLNGFRQVIDALGGITVNVREDIPINSKEIAPGVCSKPEGYVKAGMNRHLDGNEALWFARARCGGGDLADADNSRIRRQRCVINALAKSADPQTLFTRYEGLAHAVKRLVSTDIPQQLLPAFVDLGEKVQRHDARSLAFTGTTLKGTNADPDYAEIRRLAKRALQPPAKSTSQPTASPKPSPSPSPKASSTTRTDAGEKSGQSVSLSQVC